MKKIIIGLLLVLAFCAGCMSHSTAPKFTRGDVVDINDGQAVGIVMRSEYEAGRYVYWVMLGDHEAWMKENVMTFSYKFSFMPPPAPPPCPIKVEAEKDVIKVIPLPPSLRAPRVPNPETSSVPGST